MEIRFGLCSRDITRVRVIESKLDGASCQNDFSTPPHMNSHLS